ncbi:16S rRNA (uracil(1498)-N(3))-methyltransferase [Derxia gummosa]|uniref:Ribosomal RNA small subunit methyltransferase E n=1 Tax=Derxia gummosa DSM 723 TaxID=1121388 RepID=A0A8B6X1D2_9BURK|nr:16S rRNA (uracil(1498)-N(3))-methyltransferase [Derxia gummosa]
MNAVAPANLPRFFVDATLIENTTIALPPEVVRHIQVRRLGPSARVCLFNGHGGEFHAVLRDVGRDTVIAHVREHVVREAELPYAITLAQALCPGDKIDWIIEKAVELGVANFVPVQAERGIIKLVGDRAERRHGHWLGVIRAACEQCTRNTLPGLQPIRGVRDFIASHHAHFKLIASPRARRPLNEALLSHGAPLEGQTVTLLIGPEGGFTDAEEAFALQNGFHPISLGPRVLRTETAGLAAIATIQAVWGQ